ncbi:MAG: site-specific DNA-methyltransferase, partial [Anaerolineae bacterium]|nr:site-specific DNA-methyltransferase [Anaerolineae bacterium]
MQNLLQDLQDLLAQDARLIAQDGTLLKNLVIELGLKLDPDLLRLLLSHPRIQQRFFVQVDGVLIFDRDKFLQFVNNKEFLPDSYTAFKNKVGLSDDGGETYLSRRREVTLVWPYKDCVLEGGQTQEDAKRDEVFWNTTLAPDDIDRLLDPKVLTGWRRVDAEGEHSVTDLRPHDNLIIKGNNLLALHSLIRRFGGKVKLIYIDPPYNTQGDANTFLYNNTFNHSTWLSFMRSRIAISYELMRSNGVIAIAVDDEEQAYLKVLCDEVFGRENYMGTLVIQIKPSGRTTDAYFATCHEYVIFYSKEPKRPNINFFELTEDQKHEYNEGEGEDRHKWRDFLRTGGYSTPEERPNSYYPIYFNPDTEGVSLEQKGPGYVEILPLDSSGARRVWRKIPESFADHARKGEIQIIRRSDGTYKVQLIDRIKRGTRPKSIWVDSKYDASSHGTKLLKDLFGGERVFSFPKSLYAVKDVIAIFTEEGGDDIILDFFAGSGTTAHAVLELNSEDGGNRQFILCEQLDYVENVTSERVKRVIRSNSGAFVYCE